MSLQAQILIDLALAAVEWHDTLRRHRMDHICPPKFADAVNALEKALREPTEDEMILYALDRAVAPRAAGVECPTRMPPYELERLASNIYQLRMNGRTFRCEHSVAGWLILQLL